MCEDLIAKECHRIVSFAGSVPQGYSTILSLVLTNMFSFSPNHYDDDDDDYEDDEDVDDDDADDDGDGYLCGGPTLHEQFGNIEISSMGGTVQGGPALLFIMIIMLVMLMWVIMVMVIMVIIMLVMLVILMWVIMVMAIMVNIMLVMLVIMAMMMTFVSLLATSFGHLCFWIDQNFQTLSATLRSAPCPMRTWTMS